MFNVLNDKRLMDLVSRIDRAEDNYKPDMIMLVGYDRVNERVQHVRIFSNQQEFESRFTAEERAKFNGRIVTHVFGTPEYECLTDIVDNTPKQYRGQWMIAGRKLDGALKIWTFPTKDAMTASREAYFKNMRDKAIVHEFGSTTYTLVQTEAYQADDTLIEPAP